MCMHVSVRACYVHVLAHILVHACACTRAYHTCTCEHTRMHVSIPCTHMSVHACLCMCPRGRVSMHVHVCCVCTREHTRSVCAHVHEHMCVCACERALRCWDQTLPASPRPVSRLRTLSRLVPPPVAESRSSCVPPGQGQRQQNRPRAESARGTFLASGLSAGGT